MWNDANNDRMTIDDYKKVSCETRHVTIKKTTTAPAFSPLSNDNDEDFFSFFFSLLDGNFLLLLSVECVMGPSSAVERGIFFKIVQHNNNHFQMIHDQRIFFSLPPRLFGSGLKKEIYSKRRRGKEI